MAAKTDRSGSVRARGRPPKGRDDVSVKLDRGLVCKARLVASKRGTSIAELLTGMLQGPLGRAFAVIVRELDAKGKS